MLILVSLNLKHKQQYTNLLTLRLWNLECYIKGLTQTTKVRQCAADRITGDYRTEKTTLQEALNMYVDIQ